MHVDNQEPILVVMSNRRSFDRRRKLDGLFKTAVGDFQLMENKTVATMCVAAATADRQQRLAYLDLQFVRTDAGQIDLHEPAVSRTIDVRRRIPEPVRRPYPPIRSDQRELLIDVSHSKRIREKQPAIQ